MPLTPVPELLHHALVHGYAVGYFESWSIDSLHGVIDAAEQSHASVIIGFNGEFMSQPSRIVHERLSWYGALGRAAAESASVPCGFIFNECSQSEWVSSAVKAGFNLVMPVAAEGESSASYIARVQKVTEYAHRHGVAVEAELGTLPHGESEGQLTDPQAAAAFVAATGIDILAVSVGNVHVLLEGQRDLDLDLLRAISEKVQIPLALHGGTGISGDTLAKAIPLGVAKVNYGTFLKQRYLKAVRKALNSDQADPHRLLGMGGPEDVMVAGRHAVKEAVIEKMFLLGCCGRTTVHD